MNEIIVLIPVFLFAGDIIVLPKVAEWVHPAWDYPVWLVVVVDRGEPFWPRTETPITWNEFNKFNNDTQWNSLIHLLFQFTGQWYPDQVAPVQWQWVTLS